MARPRAVLSAAFRPPLTVGTLDRVAEDDIIAFVAQLDGVQVTVASEENRVPVPPG